MNMKKLTTYALCLLIAVLPACQAFTPQQRESGKIAVQDAYEKGQLTQQQRDDAIAALEGESVDWTSLLTTGGSIIASILLGVPVAVGVVQRKRGPTEAQRQAARKA
jgi:hypothetical protein